MLLAPAHCIALLSRGEVEPRRIIVVMAAIMENLDYEYNNRA